MAQKVTKTSTKKTTTKAKAPAKKPAAKAKTTAKKPTTKAKAAPKKPAAKAAPKKTAAAAKTSIKKPTTKAKTAAKKPAVKSRAAAKPAPKKTTVRKPVVKAKPRAAKPAASRAITRRPPNNPFMPPQYVQELASEFLNIRTQLEDYAAHLRALDRKRLNEVGIRRQGFIERAYEYAVSNPEFLPHYLTLQKFQEDNEYFLSFQNLFDTCTQIKEILWNITVESADIVYTDALEFYAAVREASNRRVDAAESIHNALEIFFKRKKGTSEEQTKKKTRRDMNSLLNNTRDGTIIIENIKPKLTGGSHKIIDKEYKDSARFKDNEEGELIE